MAPCSGGPHARGRRGACGVRPIARPRQADLPHRMVQWCDATCSRPAPDNHSRYREAWIVPFDRGENRIRISVRDMGAFDAGIFRRAVGASGVFRSSHLCAAGASPPRRAFTCHHFTPNAKSRGTTPMNPHALALGLSLPVLALAGALPVQHTPRQDRGHCLQRERPAERAAPRRGPAGTGSLLAGEMNQPPVEAPSANPPMVSPREPCPHGMSRRMRRVMLAAARRVSFALRGSRAS
jgi:hypothetical protein